MKDSEHEILKAKVEMLEAAVLNIALVIEVIADTHPEGEQLLRVIEPLRSNTEPSQ